MEKYLLTFIEFKYNNTIQLWIQCIIKTSSGQAGFYSYLLVSDEMTKELRRKNCPAIVYKFICLI